MKNISELKIHMECGCVLRREELGYRHTCPEHKKNIAFYTRPCIRCGAMSKLTSSKHVIYLCDDCDKVVTQAKIIYNNHNMDYVDPALWHKENSEIGEDIITNILLGYEEIQIDEPISVQHQKKTIRIDFNLKSINLNHMRNSNVFKASR